MCIEIRGGSGGSGGETGRVSCTYIVRKGEREKSSGLDSEGRGIDMEGRNVYRLGRVGGRGEGHLERRSTVRIVSTHTGGSPTGL